MKTFLIVATVLTLSISQPTQMDYIPPSSPATQPNPNVFDLSTVTSWETDKEDSTLILTLTTETGDMYVLEKETHN